VFSIDEGNLIFEIKHSSGNQDEPPHEWQRSYRINPETLCQFTGLTAEWFNEGIDPKIWSGDIFEIESVSGSHKFKVSYERAACRVQRLGNEEIEYLLCDFLSDRVYTKIGNIHDKPQPNEN